MITVLHPLSNLIAKESELTEERLFLSTTIDCIRVKKIINFNVMHEQVVEETSISSVNMNPSNQSVEVRGSPPEVFLRKGVLKISSKFTGEHQCRSVI